MERKACKMTFIYDLRPIPAPRPRITRFGAYNDGKYTKYKNTIKSLTKIDKPLQGALKMELIFQTIIPKSWTKKKKLNYKNIIPVGDVDNYSKGIMDALNNHAFIDDRQIVELKIIKRYGRSNMIIAKINEIEKES